ncbi:hypothetical protein MRX96_022165 [Rhipicephalus microplus]
MREGKTGPPRPFEECWDGSEHFSKEFDVEACSLETSRELLLRFAVPALSRLERGQGGERAPLVCFYSGEQTTYEWKEVSYATGLSKGGLSVARLSWVYSLFFPTLTVA